VKKIMTKNNSDNLKLSWCDFHKHVRNAEDAERSLSASRGFLDCYPALLYPYKDYWQNGLWLEADAPGAEHPQIWEEIVEVVARHDDPGNFVALAGYEWHGDRKKFGDLNVFYFGDAPALTYPKTLGDLYAHLRIHNGIAIPHHTAYAPGHCATDWNAIDPQLSPVVDLFSVHGSSEAVGRGDLLTSNRYMGPGVSGGTAQDALESGLHIGFIAANDGDGLPGSWNMGLGALWCEEKTRKGIRNALAERRTYGVTGDRIKLWFAANEQPMGSIIEARGGVTLDVDATGSDAIDRIELLRNNRVIETHCHRGSWEYSQLESHTKIKSRFLFGWGPTKLLGFGEQTFPWRGELRVNGGRLLDVEPCFSDFGQSFDHVDERTCRWNLTISTTRPPHQPPAQGLIFELEANSQTTLSLEVEGVQLELFVRDLMQRTQVWGLEAESLARFEARGISADQIPNAGNVWASSRKIKSELAAVEAAYRVTRSFRDEDPPVGRENFYYVRVTQNNGQMAWSSPIWVTQK
jgi:hypothetical protein